MALQQAQRLVGLQIDVALAMIAIAAQVEKQLGIDCTVMQGERSDAYQHSLFMQGRTQNSDGSWSVTNPSAVVTDADSGQSAHDFYCAADIWCLTKDGTAMDWGNTYMASIIANIARSNPNLRWGGDFTDLVDRPHVEYANWGQVAVGTLTIQTYAAPTS